MINTLLFQFNSSFLVDAHVGKALFHGAILDLRNRGKSVILVTHALHFLSNCNYIYTLHDGRIEEHGTFDQLISNKGEFARLDKEFSGGDSQAPSDEKKATSTVQSIDEIKSKSARGAAGSGKLDGKLIVKERRTTGSVSLKGALMSSSRTSFLGTNLVESIRSILSRRSRIRHSPVPFARDHPHARKPDHEHIYISLVASKVIPTFTL